VPARHDGREVFHEHHGVKRVARETAPDEEGAALAQEAPHHRDVEVDARGDVRDRVTLVIDDVRQQHVVHVAAMTGHVHHFVATVGDFLERGRVVELHAVVDAVPHPAQQLFGDLHERVRIVSRDLEGVLARQQQSRAVLVVFLARFGGHHRAHRARAQDLRDDGPAMREVRPDARGPLAAQDAAKHPRDAPRLVAGRRRIHQRLQRDGLAHLHHDVAAVDEHRDELSRARGQRPVLGEQQPEPRAFLQGRASPVHHGGHHEHVAGRVTAQRLDHRHQVRRRTPSDAGIPEPAPPADIEVREPLFDGQASRTLFRQRQRHARGHVRQHREIRHRIPVEYVTHGLVGCDQRRRQLRGLHGGSHPNPEKSPQQPAHETKLASCNVRRPV
jgi:hypothetical protein